MEVKGGLRKKVEILKVPSTPLPTIKKDQPLKQNGSTAVYQAFTSAQTHGKKRENGPCLPNFNSLANQVREKRFSQSQRTSNQLSYHMKLLSKNLFTQDRRYSLKHGQNRKMKSGQVVRT